MAAGGGDRVIPAEAGLVEVRFDGVVAVLVAAGGAEELRSLTDKSRSAVWA